MTPASALPPWDAVVLAGGASRRMGGVDKTRLDVGGRSLLDRVLDAVAGASREVVVGPAGVARSRPGRLDAREEPPGGGPVAAVAAALPLLREQVVVLLAADLPFAGGLPPTLVAALVRTPGADAVVPVDAEGHRQPLAAAYHTVALTQAVAAVSPTAGRSFREVLARLRVVELPAGALPPGALVDVDTPEDLARARAGTSTVPNASPSEAGTPGPDALLPLVAGDRP